MKKLLIIVLLLALALPVWAETIFEAVTPDYKESDIGKIKVREYTFITKEDQAVIDKYGVEVPPVNLIHRLEIIDAEVADLKAQLKEKLALRDKVFKAASTVKLADYPPIVWQYNKAVENLDE